MNEQTVERIRSVVRAALAHRRQAIVYALAERLHDVFSEMNTVASSAAAEAPWQEIESLSQLRAAVGGRFQNLKQRWVAAGFPLREHRGDRSETAEINSEGWIELVAWINQQGFEARIPDAEEKALLLIRGPLKNQEAVPKG